MTGFVVQGHIFTLTGDQISSDWDLLQTDVEPALSPHPSDPDNYPRGRLQWFLNNCCNL